MSNIDPASLPSAPLRRRFAAMFYDAFLLLAVLFIATAILTIPFMTSANNTLDTQSPIPLPLLQTYLFIVGFLFYAFFWTRGGQTLGMRAWRLRLQTRQGYIISWWQAMLRYIIATLPWLTCGLIIELLKQHTSFSEYLLNWLWILPTLGIFWSIIDSEGMTWYDRYAETRLVLLPKS